MAEEKYTHHHVMGNIYPTERQQTFVFGAKRAISAAAALPALFSSIKLIVELMSNRQIIPTKSCQSGPCP